MRLALIVTLTMFALTACDDAKPDPTGSLCGDGEAIEVLGVRHCVYPDTLIIEGFLCPGEVPERHDLEEVVVCSDSETLSDAFLVELEAKGYNPDPVEVEPGAPCDRDGARGRADCNSCVCENGSWSCTEIACAQPTGCAAQTTEQACSEQADDCEWAICAQDASCPNPSGGACVDSPVTGQACGPDPLHLGRVCEVCNCDDGTWSCEGTPCQQCAAFTNAGDCQDMGPGCSWAQCPQDDFDCPNPEGGICVDPPSSGDACELPGVAGADSADGCNSCYCDDGGFWACTEIACG